MIPTVGFNMRKVTKGNVSIKLWGKIPLVICVVDYLIIRFGRPTSLSPGVNVHVLYLFKLTQMWERYCRGVNAIVYACFYIKLANKFPTGLF